MKQNEMVSRSCFCLSKFSSLSRAYTMRYLFGMIFTMYTIAGLGNPGEEYETSRHNTGRIVLEKFLRVHESTPWKEDKKNKVRVARVEVDGVSARVVEPNSFMNNSGRPLSVFIKNKKQAEQLIVVYDDIDLPLGMVRVAFNRGSGGHRGVESVIRSLKTKEFIRVRVGIAQTTPSGKIKKLREKDTVVDFLIHSFKPKEIEVIREKTAKTVKKILETIVREGRITAMNNFN